VIDVRAAAAARRDGAAAAAADDDAVTNDVTGHAQREPRPLRAVI